MERTVGERHGALKLPDWDVSTLRKLYSMKDRGIWHPDDLAAAFELTGSR